MEVASHAKDREKIFATASSEYPRLVVVWVRTRVIVLYVLEVNMRDPKERFSKSFLASYLEKQ
jgi:hypothetical protein